jgi:hypothetical protein
MAEANEFFYLDDAGRKQDAELHNPILRTVDYPIDEKIMAPIRARHRAEHLAKQQAKLRSMRWLRVKARATRLVNGQNDLYRKWDEAEHPRHPAGSPEGGQFVGDGGGSGGGGSEDPRQPDAVGAGDSPAGNGQRAGAFGRESPSGADRSRNVVAIYRPTPQASAEMKARGHAPLSLYELGGTEGAKTFHNAITRAKTGEFGASVTAYEPDDYKGMRLFTTPDGRSGFALKGDDIVSLFKHPDQKAKGVATTMLALATQQGGRRLDCFDTALPGLYDRSGFRAVARLKWNDEHKPDGWKYETYQKHNNGRPDVVFMVHDPAHPKLYAKGDGAYVRDYDDGTAAQQKSAPSVAGYNPGVRGRGAIEVDRRRSDWVATSPIKTVDDVIRAAPIAQKAFADAGRRIADELGIEFKDPGPKTGSAKGIERTEQKIAERNGLVARVTDTARGAFILDKPEQADAVIAKLARTHEVLAEPWRTIPDSSYTDRALLFRDRATGLIGEVQITEPKMAAAKKVGHELYEQARVLPNDDAHKAEKAALNAQMKALYDKVLDSYKGTVWEIVDGRSRL